MNVNAQNDLTGYNVNKQYLTITYHGKKKRKDFQSPVILYNMIHVKRLYQTILIQFRMIATLLNWIYCRVDLRKEKFSNLVVDKFCALF